MSEQPVKIVGELDEEGVGVLGRNTVGSGTTYGVRGEVDSPGGYGLATPDDAKVGGVLEASALAGSLTGGEELTDLVGDNLTVENGALNATGGDGHWQETDSLLEPADGAVEGIDVDGVHAGTVESDDWSQAAGLDTDGNVLWGGAAGLDSSGSVTGEFVESLAGGEGIDPDSIGDGDTLSVAWEDAAGLDSDGAIDPPRAGRYLEGGDSEYEFTGPAEWENDGDTATNTAGGTEATVGGGANNEASGGQATVAGGTDNTASGSYATVGGGQSNEASGDYATVGGGGGTYLGDNTASGEGATIAGGEGNQATNSRSSVGGGRDNVSSGWQSTVAGGNENTASGHRSAVGGGHENEADGTSAAVPGGQDNVADGFASLAAGRGARALDSGSFVWADSTSIDANSVAFESQDIREFAARATGGFRFVTAVDGSGNPTAGAELGSGEGSWDSLSARAAKENVEPIDSRDVLAGVERLEISTWTYDGNDDVPHLGPMAEDFHEQFGLGRDERRISTVDADGVAFAAIQGLADRLEAENERLREELATRDERTTAQLEEERRKRHEQLEAYRDRIDGLADENERLRGCIAELTDRLDAVEAHVSGPDEATTAAD